MTTDSKLIVKGSSALSGSSELALLRIIYPYVAFSTLLFAIAYYAGWITAMLGADLIAQTNIVYALGNLVPVWLFGIAFIGVFLFCTRRATPRAVVAREGSLMIVQAMLSFAVVMTLAVLVAMRV